MARKEPDVYKNVWNNVDDEEGEMLTWVKNGTLFVPTWEELARRHESVAKFHLRMARKFGRTDDGIQEFNEALFHQKMARRAYDKHHEVLTKSR